MRNRNFNEVTYKFGRGIVCAVFRLFLHPTILNKELIPKSGAVIFCGNHLHVWDQFPLMCATNRPIHWMAKKEYFEGKLAPFFRLAGCIPVDRWNDPHQSKEVAIDYLNQGSAVGLFPEGTRNQYQVAVNKLHKYERLYNQSLRAGSKAESYLRELQTATAEIDQAKKTIESKGNTVVEGELLLPLKFGAVSMAQKTGAWIVPFGVTGDYVIGNHNLMVRIGKPFQVKDQDLEAANIELKNRITDLVKMNYSD
ncbi:MAG: lysophospholipid acyltransferase family protein [bacterium]|nr:lysophospholipid acyltransferase family protein [bacterium]